MAAASGRSGSCSWLLLLSATVVACHLLATLAVASDVPIVNGLSFNFYDKSCSKVESIIRTELKKIFKEDIGQAAGLLRLHFHDCFVQVIKLY